MSEEKVKLRYRMVLVGSRHKTYYYDDTVTGVRKSLHTKDEAEAITLLNAKNEAHRNPHLNRQMARVYLSGTDPDAATRTWQAVMDDVIQDKKGPTLKRWITANKDESFNLIRNKVILETTPQDLLEVLRDGTVSTNVYLRRLQNHALGMNWLHWPILPKKQFPKVQHKEARGVTRSEQKRILEAETNPERKDFYELCWYLGGSQTDVASLQAEDIDWPERTVTYSRQKSGKPAIVQFGAKVEEILKRRPSEGPLFPYLITVRESDRATEFGQRCDLLQIKGITLQSYRYAWAERAAECGYPERFAMEALGHGSKLVTRAYAKRAKVKLPPLEDYEKAKREGKIIDFQAVVPNPLSEKAS